MMVFIPPSWTESAHFRLISCWKYALPSGSFHIGRGYILPNFQFPVSLANYDTRVYRAGVLRAAEPDPAVQAADRASLFKAETWSRRRAEPYRVPLHSGFTRPFSLRGVANSNAPAQFCQPQRRNQCGTILEPRIPITEVSRFRYD